MPFSIGLAEYAVAGYMVKVLENEDAAVTIIAENSLQRDLIRDVYSKKRSASTRFLTNAPHIISLDQVYECLPIDDAMFTKLTSDKQPEI